jgi:hypothetical protein
MDNIFDKISDKKKAIGPGVEKKLHEFVNVMREKIEKELAKRIDLLKISSKV